MLHLCVNESKPKKPKSTKKLRSLLIMPFKELHCVNTFQGNSQIHAHAFSNYSALVCTFHIALCLVSSSLSGALAQQEQTNLPTNRTANGSRFWVQYPAQGFNVQQGSRGLNHWPSNKWAAHSTSWARGFEASLTNFKWWKLTILCTNWQLTCSVTYLWGEYLESSIL